MCVIKLAFSPPFNREKDCDIDISVKITQPTNHQHSRREKEVSPVRLNSHPLITPHVPGRPTTVCSGRVAKPNLCLLPERAFAAMVGRMSDARMPMNVLGVGGEFSWGVKVESAPTRSKDTGRTRAYTASGRDRARTDTEAMSITNTHHACPPPARPPRAHEQQLAIPLVRQRAEEQ